MNKDPLYYYHAELKDFVEGRTLYANVAGHDKDELLITQENCNIIVVLIPNKTKPADPAFPSDPIVFPIRQEEIVKSVRLLDGILTIQLATNPLRKIIKLYIEE